MKTLDSKNHRTLVAAPKERGPKPPFPRQHQRAPGLEAKLTPRPRYTAPEYLAAGKLRGRRALITGGDSGIGRAVAVLYAREGADLAISYLPQEQQDAEETRRAVEFTGRRCVLIPADLSDEKAAPQIVARAARELGGLDLLVSNAAHQESKASIKELDDKELEFTYRVNFFALVRLIRTAVPLLPPGSAIVITSSETGLLGKTGLPDYSSTKGAINALVKALAAELLEKGIRVNAVAPGPVWTPLNPSDAGRTPKEVSEFGSMVPMGRPAQPDELSPAYVFLASNADSSYITGIVLPVMGGEPVGG
ncbi:MAG TPA: SDR family oxidoreductase [Opitutaceae bacterium]|jgi:NAD(P)-dependent dehydrogenase (short-subunit alcohol dehydrogenase family)|nr:SDR family oxidoreductase [Opitutaceae bacterium]